jgi:SAM-dependent methyltransferase
MSIDKYQRFYDEVDRETKYSKRANTEDHAVYPLLVRCIEKYNLQNSKCLEIGSGNGRFQDIVDDYTGIDVSDTLNKYYHKPFVSISHSQPYPFDNESFDFIFTNVAFEHIPNIDFALYEMKRILKDDGIVYFKPAWNCRPWAADGYQVRPFSDFTIPGKTYKLLIPILDNIVLRFLIIFPKRLYYFAKYLLNNNMFQERLKYKKLKPNYEHYWQSDSDACNSLDIFLTILYFKANRYDVLNYRSWISQIMLGNSELILRKRKNESISM